MASRMALTTWNFVQVVVTTTVLQFAQALQDPQNNEKTIELLREVVVHDDISSRVFFFACPRRQETSCIDTATFRVTRGVELPVAIPKTNRYDGRLRWCQHHDRWKGIRASMEIDQLSDFRLPWHITLMYSNENYDFHTYTGDDTGNRENTVSCYALELRIRLRHASILW